MIDLDAEDDAEGVESRQTRPPLAPLSWLVARDSNLTFGGGTATAEVLRRSLGRRGWLSEDDHRHLYAISRLTPGTNLLAYCTAVGWRLRGLKGATVAWLASSIPASLVAIVATVFYERAASSPALSIVVVLGTGIALVLLIASAWHLARPQLARHSMARSATIVASAGLLIGLGLSPIGVLLASGFLGSVWTPRAK